MQKYFEKIIDTLRTESRHAKHCFDFKTASAFNAAITIVNVVFDDMDKGKVSDGYHTFDELYHHRAVLFSVICNTHKELAWKSKLHDTGDMYDGMFIVGIETPEGQATYHYDINPYWDMFDVKELPKAPKWDGHTPDEAIRRIGLLGSDINVLSNKSEFVRRGAYERVTWERDIAIAQLHELGYEFGQKIDSNDGWIPVSEFMPADLGEDWVQVQIQEADTGFLWIPRTAEYRNDKWWLTDSDKPLEDVFEVTAWRKLPPYYQPKGEE